MPMPMPSSRAVGRMWSSMLRLRSEYSICRSQIGCTAAARRMVSAPTSDRPMWRTYPAWTISAMAQMVSLDRDIWVQPRRPIDVDMVGAGATQTAGESVLDRNRVGLGRDRWKPPAGSLRLPNLTLIVT